MSSSLPIATEPPPPGEAPSEQAGPPRVVSYLLLPDDPAKAEALRARLAAYQRSLGLPLGVYEERCRDRRRRPLRARLLHRAAGGGIDIVVVPAVRHLASTRARVCQLVCRLDVPVLTLTGLRFDPSDRIVRWVARERAEHQRRIRRGLAEKKRCGERSGTIPSGQRLAADGVHLEPDPDEQRAIAIARELSGSGMSLRAIARHLTEAGHRSRRGGRVTHTQVGRWSRGWS